MNLERTNLGDLTTDLVPDVLELVTLDLSYLSIAPGDPELDRVRLTPDAELVALVKPMFELALGRPPDDEERLAAAVAAARARRRGRAAGTCSPFRSRRPAAGVEQSSSCSTLAANRAFPSIR